MFSGSSNTSSESTRKVLMIGGQRLFTDIPAESSETDNLHATDDSRMNKVRERAAMIVPLRPTTNGPAVNYSQASLDATLARRKSKWSIFQRKTVDITAH